MNSFGIGINQYFSYYFVLESEKINSNLSWHSQKNDISASSINSVQFIFSLSMTTLASAEYSWITVFLAKQMYLCDTPGFRLSSVQYSSYIFRRILSYLPRGPWEYTRKLRLLLKTIFLGVLECNAISKRVCLLIYIFWLEQGFRLIPTKFLLNGLICLIFVVCLARKRICIF